MCFLHRYISQLSTQLNKFLKEKWERKGRSEGGRKGRRDRGRKGRFYPLPSNYRESPKTISVSPESPEAFYPSLLTSSISKNPLPTQPMLHQCGQSLSISKFPSWIPYSSASSNSKISNDKMDRIQSPNCYRTLPSQPIPCRPMEDGHSRVSGLFLIAPTWGGLQQDALVFWRIQGPDRSRKRDYGHSLQPIPGSGTLTALKKNYLSIMMKTERGGHFCCTWPAELTLGSPQTLTQTSNSWKTPGSWKVLISPPQRMLPQPSQKSCARSVRSLPLASLLKPLLLRPIPGPQVEDQFSTYTIIRTQGGVWIYLARPTSFSRIKICPLCSARFCPKKETPLHFGLWDKHEINLIHTESREHISGVCSNGKVFAGVVTEGDKCLNDPNLHWNDLQHTIPSPKACAPLVFWNLQPREAV